MSTRSPLFLLTWAKQMLSFRLKGMSNTVIDFGINVSLVKYHSQQA